MAADQNKKEAGAFALTYAVLEIVNYQKLNGDNFTRPKQEAGAKASASEKQNETKNRLLGTGSVSKSQGESPAAGGKGLEDGVITVQYNPKSLKFSGSSSQSTDSSVEEGGRRVMTITSKGTLRMSVELVFHSKAPGDTSVADQMNLIMMQLQYGATREVKFSWANIVMQGEIVSFSGKYDMFDSAGNPLSGSMNLTIQATDVKVEKSYEAIKEERSQKLAR